MFRFLNRPDCVMSAPVKALITPQLHADVADASDDHRFLSFEWWAGVTSGSHREMGVSKGSQ